MDQIEGLTNRSLVEVAARTDELSSAPFGSQRVPIDRNIDTEKLRGWLQDQMLDATQRQQALPMEDAAAIKLAGQEMSYYHEMLGCLDEG